MDNNLVVVLGALVASVVLYFVVKHFVPMIKMEISLREVEAFLFNLKEIALTIGDNEQDKVTNKIYDILMITFDYLDEIMQEGEPDLEEALAYVVALADEANIELNQDDKENLLEAINLIVKFLK